MRLIRLAACAAPLLLAAPAAGQLLLDDGHMDRPLAEAVRAQGPVHIDGRLDEPAWALAPVIDGFRQIDPDEGAPVSQRTEVRILFDDDALYIGARLFDEGPITTRLGRRDMPLLDADWFGVVIDSYHGHQTGFVFDVNPSGVQRDAVKSMTSSGESDDNSWDAVWDVATSIDDEGWSAEYRIPFSQLRFNRAERQLWGIQLERVIGRRREYAVTTFIPKSERGGIPAYGHLVGVQGVSAGDRLELLPYVVARGEYVDPGANPFRTDSEHAVSGGLDARYRVTSDMTLNASINPDFGQVEVDPAVVNLTAFETFFDEKRPFFIEGGGLFGYGGLWCFFCSNVSSLNVFYSRRIGARPPGATLAEDAGEYADVPANTAILGAAKVTGRTAGGTTVAVLNAVTRREHAPVMDEEGRRFTQEVAPLTNYFVGRVKHDLLGGNLVVGGVFSSVYRNIGDPALADHISRHAEVGGVDAELWWGDRTYHLLTNFAVSQVSGEAAAIRRLQRSSVRYFHRPDRDAAAGGFFSHAYDPDATCLRGYGAYVRLAKDAGDWQWELSTNLRSPGFETNDIAFQIFADYVWMSGNVLRQFTRPTRYFRHLTLIAGGQQQVNYDGDLTDRQVHAYVGGQLPNYWNASAFYIHGLATLDDRLTRGGPVVRKPAYGYLAFNLSTDSRRPLVLGTNPNHTWREDGTRSYFLNLDVTFRPASNVSLSLGPSFRHNGSSRQYVDAWDDETATAFYGRRYLFAELEQRTLSVDTRLSVTFSPTLSLEVFVQPLISSARYTGFREFVAPRSGEMIEYGRDFGAIWTEGTGEDRTYTVDPDGPEGPNPGFTFEDPDFNFRSLRGNAVLRWEYLPGSTLYLVWTQDRSHTAHYGDVRLARDGSALLRAQPDNVFMIKASYWLGL